MALASAFSLIVLWLDVVLVGALASTRQAGIYAVASRCVILATFPMVAPRVRHRAADLFASSPAACSAKLATCTRLGRRGSWCWPGRSASSWLSSRLSSCASSGRNLAAGGDDTDHSQRGHVGEHRLWKLWRRALHDRPDRGQSHHRISRRRSGHRGKFSLLVPHWGCAVPHRPGRRQ